MPLEDMAPFLDSEFLSNMIVDIWEDTVITKKFYDYKYIFYAPYYQNHLMA